MLEHLLTNTKMFCKKLVLNFIYSKLFSWNHRTDIISTSICGAGTTKRSVVLVQPKDNHEQPKDVSVCNDTLFRSYL